MIWWEGDGGEEKERWVRGKSKSERKGEMEERRRDDADMGDVVQMLVNLKNVVIIVLPLCNRLYIH